MIAMPKEKAPLDKAGKLALLKAQQTPVPKAFDGFTNISEKKPLDNPFSRTSWKNQISLSVFNTPKVMAQRRPVTCKTTEELVRRLPGFKPIPPKLEKDENGDPIPPPEPTEKPREPVLPQFKVDFQPVIKDATDSLRREQIREIQSLRDYLSKQHVKQISNSDQKESKTIAIPMMKTFERAILVPQESAYDIKDKKYPEAGSRLMENPFPKKKKKKGKKGGKKKRR